MERAWTGKSHGGTETGSIMVYTWNGPEVSACRLPGAEHCSSAMPCARLCLPWSQLAMEWTHKTKSQKAPLLLYLVGSRCFVPVIVKLINAALNSTAHCLSVLHSKGTAHSAALICRWGNYQSHNAEMPLLAIELEKSPPTPAVAVGVRSLQLWCTQPVFYVPVSGRRLGHGKAGWEGTVDPWLLNSVSFQGLVIVQVGCKSKLFFP